MHRPCPTDTCDVSGGDASDVGRRHRRCVFQIELGRRPRRATVNSDDCARAELDDGAVPPLPRAAPSSCRGSRSIDRWPRLQSPCQTCRGAAAGCQPRRLPELRWLSVMERMSLSRWGGAGAARSFTARIWMIKSIFYKAEIIETRYRSWIISSPVFFFYIYI